jgi:hypothetical protein
MSGDARFSAQNLHFLRRRNTWKHLSAICFDDSPVSSAWPPAGGARGPLENAFSTDGALTLVGGKAYNTVQAGAIPVLSRGRGDEN